MHSLQNLDAAVFHAINGSTPHALALVARVLSWIGSVGGIAGWLAVIFVAVRRSGGPGVAFCAVSCTLTVAFAWILKHVVVRERPWTVFPESVVVGPHEMTSSFPSAHTAVSFALATAVALRWPRAGKVAYLLAIGVGLSRIVMGMHYPSDVVAGAVLGSGMSTMLGVLWPRPEGVLGRRVVLS